MNLNNNPTKKQLADLLRACDDRAGQHVLWVDRGGEVHITPTGDVADFVSSHPDVQMWLREFAAGEGFVGPNGAEDAGWVEDLYLALTREWPVARGRTEAVTVEDW